MYSVEMVDKKREADPDFDRMLKSLEGHFA